MADVSKSPKKAIQEYAENDATATLEWDKREPIDTEGHPSKVGILLRPLLRIGLVRRCDDGSIRWPVHILPLWMWCSVLRIDGWFGVFRNKPGVIRREPGRLLPRRWGFRIWFLEIGDRG